MESLRGGFLFLVRWFVHYPIVFGTYRVRNWVRAPFFLQQDLLNKPGILVSNYGNLFYDDILGAMLGPVWPFTFVRDSIFRIPVLRPFFRVFRCLPFVRANDMLYTGDERHSRNEEIFGEVIRRLRDGHWFAVFPEVTVGDRAQLQTPLRPGAAYVALRAEDAAGWGLSLRIYVYGTNYENKLAGRSNLYVRWATPVEVSKYREIFAKDPAAAEAALMTEIERALHSVVLEAESVEVLADAHRLAFQRQQPNFGGVVQALSEVRSGRGAPEHWVPTGSRRSELRPEDLHHIISKKRRESVMYQVLGVAFVVLGGILGWPFRAFGRLAAVDRSQEMAFQVLLWVLVLVTGSWIAGSVWPLMQVGTTWVGMQAWLWAWRRGLID